MIVANFGDPIYNLSFKRLSECTEIQSDLSRAHWLLLETEDVDLAVNAVENFGAQYTRMPYGNVRTDYVERAMTLVTERL